MYATVFCPMCGRGVELDKLGAKDLNGFPVMPWHYACGCGCSGQCDGSNRSVESCQAEIDKENAEREE